MTGFLGIDYLITKETIDYCIENIDKAFNSIIKLLSSSEMLEKVLDNSVVEPVTAAVKASALTLCVLFFLIDFFEKTLNLQWVKWENVMMLFIKLVFAKVIIDISPELCEAIYSGFSSIAKSVLDVINGDEPFELIGAEEYEMLWLSEDEANALRSPPTLGFLDFKPLLIQIKTLVMGSIMVIMELVCISIIIGRIFELAIYTIIAPLPLSTFASDGLKEVGKGFLKSYAAVSIQALVMMIMIIAYMLIVKGLPSIGAFDGLLKTLAFTLSIMQSGSWAKRICNAM